MTASFVMTKNFKDGFKKFTEATGKDLKEYMREVMKLLVETCYHWTPPPTKGNRGERGGQKGGKAVIAQDIYWITAAVSERYLGILYNAFGEEIISGRFKRKDGSTYLIELVNINYSGGEAAVDRYHESRRKQNGRVLTHAGRTSVNIGRWKPRNKMLMSKEVRDRYLKNTQKRVGKLKSGWGYALEQVKSKLPPNWVGNAGNLKGHSGFAPSGGFEDKMTEEWSGHMDAINKVRYFRDIDGFMNRAHRHVESFMRKGGKPLQGFIERMIKRHGATA